MFAEDAHAGARNLGELRFRRYAKSKKLSKSSSVSSMRASYKRRVHLTSVGENTHHPSVDAVSRNYTSLASIHISKG